jgi:hypothetical protein
MDGRQRNAWPGVASSIPDKIYGPQGEILLDRSTDGPVVGRLTGTPGVNPDVHLRNPKGFLFTESLSNNHATTNSYYDSLNWNRFDVSAGTIQSILTGRTLLLRSAPAGANPVAAFPAVTQLLHGANVANDWGFLLHGVDNQDNFIIGTSGLLYIGSNLTTADGGTTWNRIDTTLGATMVQYQRSTGIVQYFYVGPGANPVAAFTQYGMNISQVIGWTALPYATNWSDYGIGGQTPGGYRVNPEGRVFLKGLVKKAIALVGADLIATLPTGARPASEHIFSCASAAGYTEVRVAVNGSVYIQAGGSATWTSLSQVAFDLGT